MEELEAVVQHINRNKQSYRGCYAMVKADCWEYRLLILALMNACLGLTISVTTWGLRQYCHVRKKAGIIIHDLSQLRPVSQGTEMAAILDGLYIRRNRQKLLDYWGPLQLGGVADALLAALLLLLLCELRLEAGFPTILNFGDIKFGFDGTPQDDIRVGMFRAGIVGRMWMLMDDVLAMDAARVAYVGLISRFFTLAAGIAQGRKASVFHFNTAAVELLQHVKSRTTGVAVPPPLQRHRDIIMSAIQQPQGERGWIYHKEFCEQVARSINRNMDSAGFITKLSSIRSLSDRFAVADLCDPFPIQLVQYVDDDISPSSSWDQSGEVWQAREEYSLEHGPKYNLGKAKSCAMPVGCDEMELRRQLLYLRQPVPISHEYTYMGIFFVSSLSMVPHFNRALAKWLSAGQKHVATGDLKKISFIVLCETVPVYVESVALFGIALCIGVPSFELRLNRVQTTWARYLLGIPGELIGAMAALMVACGWTRRLGTRCIGEAIMLEARLVLQAPDGVLHHVLQNARSTNLTSWISKVARIRLSLGDIPCISGWLSASDLQKCYGDIEYRYKRLQSFRRQILLPALDIYDLQAYQLAASKSTWPFAYFQGQPMRFDHDILLADWPSLDTFQYKVWTIAKSTGRLPLSSFGFPHAVLEMDTCPLCGYPGAGLAHILSSCSGTLHIRRSFFPASRGWDDLQVLLFRGPHCVSSDGRLSYRIRYVASALQILADALHEESQ